MHVRQKRTITLAVVMALIGAVFTVAMSPVRPASAQTDGSHECVNSLGRYVGQELSPLGLSLSAPGPVATAGEPIALSDAELTGEVPQEFYLDLYRGRDRGNYSMLSIGDNAVSMEVWVAIEAANTVEGTQTVYVEAIAETAVTDPTPFIDPETGEVRTDATNYLGRTSGDESATNPMVVVELPETTWTPTGEGPVTFSEGAPGSISYPVDVEVGTPGPEWEGPTPIPQPEGTIHVDGTSTHNMNVNPYWVQPYGSTFIRVNTTSNVLRDNEGNTNGYGANMDCLLGEVEVVEGEDVPRANAHGSFEPDTELAGWTTRVEDGVEITGPDLMVSGGSLGRYTITEDDRPTFATATILDGFSDVPEDHPFFTEITWLASSGVAEGYPDGTFGPANPVTRQAMAAFLYRLAGEPAFPVPETPTFSDVPVDHPFYVPIEWLATEEIAEGFGDGTFMPGADISRQAMAAFVFGYAGDPPFDPPASPTFSDVPTDHTFYAQIEWLAETGLSEGYEDGTFEPVGETTRQATAAFLYRYVELVAVG